MKYLIIIRGLPGSGKTTLAKAFKGKGVKHFEADMFFTHGGRYSYDRSKAAESHAWCLDSVCKALEKADAKVIVSNTFTTESEMYPYIEAADAVGAELSVIHCTGEFGSTHGVPDEIMAKMGNRWEDYEGELEDDPEEDYSEDVEKLLSSFRGKE